MTQRDALLFANEVFYRAFSDRDIGLLETVWAADDDCMCVHPGWNPLFGRSRIIDSFRAIFDGPAPPNINAQIAHTSLVGNLGVVICFEEIDSQVLVATNLFRHTGTSAWHMFHHHAGPAQYLPDLDDLGEPTTTN